MRHQTGDGRFVMDRKMSVIKRCPTHLYECLWWHYFKTRNIVTLLSPVYLRYLQVIVTHHKPSSLLTPCYRSGVLDMYATLRLRRLTCTCGESGTWTSTALKSAHFSLKKKSMVIYLWTEDNLQDAWTCKKYTHTCKHSHVVTCSCTCTHY